MSASTGWDTRWASRGPSWPSCSSGKRSASHSAISRPSTRSPMNSSRSFEPAPLRRGGAARTAWPAGDGGAVGERLAQQVRAGEDVAEQRLGRAVPGRSRPRPAAGPGRQWMPVNRRLQRISKGHSQISHSGAVPPTERKMNSARPTRFSTGTKPTRVQHAAVGANCRGCRPWRRRGRPAPCIPGVLSHRAVVGGLQDVVLDEMVRSVGQDFEVSLEQHARPVALGQVVAGRLALHDGAVDVKLAALHLHAVAGQADDALDVVLAGVARQLEHGDIAALRRVAEDAAREQRRRERQREMRVAVAEFRHEQIVADHQCRDHRAGRDVERLEGDGADADGDERGIDDGLDVLDQSAGLAPGRELLRHGG